ncbi:MAG TPA: methyl-accepting chemotaxis protein, partial [Oligoflexia bacterium]|nr:methyl-accepting chemotaxis protein [Oligoflexia bacterium]
GKGFAVVAEEVRNLAARSAKAARETAEGISSSMQKIENGTKVAEVTVEALVQIEEQVTKVNDLVAEIAAASNEQAQAISQVSQGMGQIDSVTQQNTANAEETASAAEELSSQATELRDLVAQFKLRSSGEGKSWGGAAKVSAKQQHKSHSAARAQTGGREWGKTAKKADSPEYVIALDDKDFGKY